jgi:hypothetical protein
MRYALRTVRKLFGPTPLVEFGPKKPKIVRQSMIHDEGLSRGRRRNETDRS